jgi:hypothetical protein
MRGRGEALEWGYEGKGGEGEGRGFIVKTL